MAEEPETLEEWLNIINQFEKVKIFHVPKIKNSMRKLLSNQQNKIKFDNLNQNVFLSTDVKFLHTSFEIRISFG